MLREVSLELRTRSDLRETAAALGADLSIADCRPYDRDGMAMLLDIGGPAEAREGAVEAIRGMKGIRRAYVDDRGAGRTSMLVVLRKPGVCRAAKGKAVVCLDCPFNSTEAPARWTFLARPGDLAGIMSRLSDEGVSARVGSLGLYGGAGLTPRERGMVAAAVEAGYFDFPRRATLVELAKALGVRPGSLLRILRKAQ